MKYLAFVTMELYPLTAGGIGRVIYNMLATMSPVDRARTIVVLTTQGIDSSLAGAIFPEVRFETLEDVGVVSASDRYPPRSAYTNTEFHWRSVCVLRKFQNLEREGIDFEYIEFPDWGGLGFAATQEKLFGNAFRKTCLSVRLHSSAGMLMAAEAHFPNRAAVVLYDLERKMIRDCDKVVAQLMPVADCNQAVYGFDEKEWRSRLIVHAPPVLIDGTPKSKTLGISLSTPLLFTSKFQQFKAPDVFARACVGFMRNCTTYSGEVRFLAHNMDSSYVDYIKKLIPADIAHRFRFYEGGISGALRDRMISEGVAVFPSRYESFCLAAYEASLLGAPVIVNESNPAFGLDTPWVDGKNCVKFDGSVEGLVAALHRLMQPVVARSLEPVSLPSNEWPWVVAKVSAGLRSTAKNTCLPLVSVVIPNFNLGAYLPYAVRSVVDSTYPNIEIIICDDASTDSYTLEILERIQSLDLSGKSVRVIKAGYNRGLAGARNLAIKEAKGIYVLTLDADDLISSDFIETAVGALERNHEYSIVVPQVAYVSEGCAEVPQCNSEYIDFAIFHGEAVASGFTENRFSTATMLARRSLFDRMAYREELRALEDWDFYLRAVKAGERFIVTNELHFYYRRRFGSMISAFENRDRAALLRSDMRRTLFFSSGAMNVPSIAFSVEPENSVIHIQECSSELDRVLASRSWRLTMPLRVVARIFRGEWRYVAKRFREKLNRSRWK